MFIFFFICDNIYGIKFVNKKYKLEIYLCYFLIFKNKCDNILVFFIKFY